MPRTLESILKAALDSRRPLIRAQTTGQIVAGPRNHAPKHHPGGRARRGEIRHAGHTHDYVAVTLADGARSLTRCSIPGCGMATVLNHG